MKILHLPFGHDGVSHYRLILPLKAMEALGAQLFEIKPDLPDEELIAATRAADVLFVRLSDLNAYRIMEQARAINPTIAIVGDTDDDLTDITPLNNGFATMGQYEVQTDKGEFIWKHGHNKFNLHSNWRNLVDYKWSLRCADIVTTTTPRLRERLLEHNDVVAIAPNGLNEADFPRLDIKHPGVRILWSGGSSHFEDLMMVKPALKELLERHSDVELHIVGQRFGAFIKDMPRTFYHPWVHPNGNGFRLATIGCDIGICPLEDRPFNHAKSSIKYYEYSALGLATVASDTPPYSDDITPTRGALAKPEEFGTKLEELIADPIKRSSVAREARKYVLNTHTMNKLGKVWLEIFETAAKAKKEENGS